MPKTKANKRAKRPTLRAALQAARSFIVKDHRLLGRCTMQDCSYRAIIDDIDAAFRANRQR